MKLHIYIEWLHSMTIKNLGCRNQTHYPLNTVELLESHLNLSESVETKLDNEAWFWSEKHSVNNDYNSIPASNSED